MVVLPFLVVALVMYLQTTAHAMCLTMISISSMCMFLIVLDFFRTSLIETVLSLDSVLVLYFSRHFLVLLNMLLTVLCQFIVNMMYSLNLSLMIIRLKNVYDYIMCVSIFAVVCDCVEEKVYCCVN